MGEFGESAQGGSSSLDTKLTIILIVIVVMLLGVFWVVSVSVFNSSPIELIESLSGFSTELKIQSATIDETGVSITLLREKGRASIEGVIFLISDGENVLEISRDSNLQRLESQNFLINNSEIQGLNFVRNISVGPTFPLDSNPEEERVFEVTDSFEMSNSEILSGIGAVSYWNFENRARDEIGLNNGMVEGDVTFEEGLDGNSAMFDGSSGYIEFEGFDNLGKSGEFSISFWIYMVDASFPNRNGVISLGNENNKILSLVGYENTKLLFAEMSTNESLVDCNLGTAQIPLRKWTNIIFSWDGESCKFYENGILRNSDPTKGTLIHGTNKNLVIGKGFEDNFFRGSLDDISIFEKSLNSGEASIVYSISLKG